MKKLVLNHHRGKAFTLIEVLVVISIIALLLGILVPALGMVRKSAQKVKCTSNLHQISLAVQMYVENNDGYLILAGVMSPFQNIDEILSIWHNALLPYVAKSMNRKMQDLLKNTTEIWICPSDKDPYPYGYRTCRHSSITSYAPNGYYPLKSSPFEEPPDVKLGPCGGYKLQQVEQPSLCMLMGETSYSGQFYDADAEAVAGCNLNRDGHHRCTSGFYHNGEMNVLFVDGHIESVRGRQTSELVWPEGFEEPYKSGTFMYWPDLKLPCADEKPEFWGPGY